MSDRQLFETLTQAVPGLVWICDEQGRVEFNNPQWTTFTGMPQKQVLGHGWLSAIHPSDASAFRASLPLVPMSSDDIQAEISVRRHDGAYHRHIVNVRHVGDGKWVGCAIDAHEWLTTELRDANQGHILEMIAQGVQLDEVLGELCKAAERQIPGATCSLFLVDAATGKFTAGIAPGLPEDLFEAVHQIRIGTGVGSCGTAAFEQRDVISEDLLSDPYWEGWRDLVLPLGYRACWSKPVFTSDGKVVASFGFYFRQPRKPKGSEDRELNRLRGLAALAIERAQVLDALRESEEHYRHTVEQNPQVTWTASKTGDILSASPRWTELTGIPLSDALGNGWLRALHPDDLEPTIEKWELALATGRALDVTYRFRMQDGEFRWCRGRATARRDNRGKIIRWYGTVEDVHVQHLAAEQLKRQAYQDDLTGLPNRRAFVETLRGRLGKGHESLGLMVLDMDDFKMINDRFGHLAGDAILRLFARYLQAIAQPNEYLARLGGDEFAIICGNITDEMALRGRASEIETFLEQRLKANKKSRNSRASIGCTLGKSGENPDEVFKRADLALYAAKRSGKGKTELFDPTIRTAAAQRVDALELARLALREGWIEPYFQPIVNLRSQELRGFEALLRIAHPERGILSPFSIKDAFEEPKLANAIALRMAELVTGNMFDCMQSGVACGQVSINLATENLVNTDFIDALLELLDVRRLPQSAVKLEITEQVLMDDLSEAVVANLQSLREMGIGLSLDDFGTGYASLVHLQRLPVDEIKIDRSFVTGLGTAENKGEIVQAMIGLANTLGLNTVAEGVETQGEALKLAAWGCENVQGYLFGRPMPFSEAKDLFQSERKRSAGG